MEKTFAVALTLMLVVGSAVSFLSRSASAAGEVTVYLEGLQASYGPESWKNDYYPSDPTDPDFIPDVGGLAYSTLTQQNDRSLGYRMTATIKLIKSDGSAVSSSYTVSSKIMVGESELEAFIEEGSSGRYLLHFDIDGARGSEEPALFYGTHTLVVDVSESLTPIYSYAVGHGEFPIKVNSATIGGIAALPFPESNLGKFYDVGPTDYVGLSYMQFHNDAPIAVRCNLGEPGASAEIRAFSATQTGVSGAVAYTTLEEKVVASGITDENGVFEATIPKAGGLLPEGRESDIIVIAAYLTGGTGSTTVGCGQIVIPISSHKTYLMSFEEMPWDEYVGDFSKYVVDQTTVNFKDEDAGAGGETGLAPGDLFIGLPGETVNATFIPRMPTTQVCTANYDNTPIKNSETSSYTLLAMFYDGSGNFYSMSRAVRGYTLNVNYPAKLAVNEKGEISVVITSRTTDFDENLPEPGLKMKIRVETENLPGDEQFAQTVEVDELGSVTLKIPFMANKTGTYPVSILSTSGDLVSTKQVSIKVLTLEEMNPKEEKWYHKMPGFEGLFVVAAVLLAAYGYKRKRKL
ncbi:MAG: hypothetical protein CVT48_01820 [Thermoplasmata archaeon HGW-Thermoplasmata-1]|nr:MAG: hypothetical protein CVT48_01820 [Thermoplasmata archaeon HGW-Thermoplasmata-1]